MKIFVMVIIYWKTSLVMWLNGPMNRDLNYTSIMYQGPSLVKWESAKNNKKYVVALIFIYIYISTKGL